MNWNVNFKNVLLTYLFPTAIIILALAFLPAIITPYIAGAYAVYTIQAIVVLMALVFAFWMKKYLAKA